MAGAHIRIKPLNEPETILSEATTDEEGFAKTGPLPLDNGKPTSFWVEIVHKDQRGITWKFKGERAFALSSGASPVYAGWTMQRMHQVVNLRVREGAESRLCTSPEGRALLEDVNEWLSSLVHAYPSAGACLAGKILDEILRIQGRAEGWWKSEWDQDDRLTLGNLLRKPEVERALDSRFPGFHQRLLNVSVSVRNAGAHHSGYDVTMIQAMAASEVVMDLLNRWIV